MDCVKKRFYIYIRGAGFRRAHVLYGVVYGLGIDVFCLIVVWSTAVGARSSEYLLLVRQFSQEVSRCCHLVVVWLVSFALQSVI